MTDAEILDLVREALAEGGDAWNLFPGYYLSEPSRKGSIAISVGLYPTMDGDRSVEGTVKFAPDGDDQWLNLALVTEEGMDLVLHDVRSIRRVIFKGPPPKPMMGWSDDPLDMGRVT